MNTKITLYIFLSYFIDIYEKYATDVQTSELIT